MSTLKSSSISEDFPLYHNSLIPIIKTDKIIPKGKKILYKSTYTNEHPDFLKLDFMKEKGYKNPYLNEVIKVDRSEEFKKLENIKSRLELINYLKRSRKYSQDPSKLKYVQSEFDIEMNKKRKRIHEMDKSEINNRFLTIAANFPVELLSITIYILSSSSIISYIFILFLIFSIFSLINKYSFIFL